jgi:hypothetical protein
MFDRPPLDVFCPFHPHYGSIGFKRGFVNGEITEDQGEGGGVVGDCGGGTARGSSGGKISPPGLAPQWKPLASSYPPGQIHFFGRRRNKYPAAKLIPAIAMAANRFIGLLLSEIRAAF